MREYDELKGVGILTGGERKNLHHWQQTIHLTISTN